MKPITIYDSDGQILQTMHVADEDEALLNIPKGGGYVDGKLDDELFYIRNGQAQPYPEKPGDWARFDYQGGAWFDPRDLEGHAAALELVRRDVLAEINRIRGAARSRFITAIPGQDMVYLEKERLSLAWLADPEPDPEDYGSIMAEVGPGLTGETGFQVCTIILHMAAQWRRLSPAIERTSIHYLNAAQAATSEAALMPLVEQYRVSLEAAVSAALGPEG